MDDCPFCRIPRQADQPILASNAWCYLLAYPAASLLRGMMVIPFRHIETPFELSADEWQATHDLVTLARDALSGFDPDGYNLGWNVGSVGGQEVPHAHLHVFARFADEPFAGRGIRSWLKQDSNRRRGD